MRIFPEKPIYSVKPHGQTPYQHELLHLFPLNTPRWSYFTMKKLNNRTSKRRKRLAKKRQLLTQRQGSLENLEPRQLLTAVSYDGNLANDYEDGAIAADPAMVTVEVDPGYEKALVVTAGWTNTADITLEIEDISPNVSLPGAPTFTPITLTLDASQADELTSTTNAGTAISTGIWVVPIDIHDRYDAMQREFKVTMWGGASTDIFLGAATYTNVDQTTPVVDTGDARYSSDAGAQGDANGQQSTLDEGGSARQLMASSDEDMLVDAFLGIDGAGPTLVSASGQTAELNEQEAAGGSTIELDFGSSYKSAAGSPDSMQWASMNFGELYSATTHSGVVLDSSDARATQYDLGDAPDSYGTQLADDGPRHAHKGPRFGDGINREANPRAVDGFDDNFDAVGVTYGNVERADGVSIFVSNKAGTNTGEIQVDIQNLNVAEGQTAYVSAFIDWDGDGNFTDPGENVVAGFEVSDNTIYDLPSFTIPATDLITDSGSTWMRLRIHSNPMGNGEALTHLGHANDGEVEDHEISLVQGGEIHGLKFEDMNGDGVYDTSDGDKHMDNVLIGLYENAPTDKSVTVTFEDAFVPLTDPSEAIGTFEEAGFTITATTGSHTIAQVGPAPNQVLQSGHGAKINLPDPPTAWMEIRRTDGGLFTFDEYLIGSNKDKGTLEDNIDGEFEGTLGGDLVFSFTDENDDQGGPQTRAVGSGHIDRLRIRYVNTDGLPGTTGPGGNSLFLDDLDFTLVDYVQQPTDLLGNLVEPILTETMGAHNFWFENLDLGDYAVVEHIDKTDTNKDGILDAGDDFAGQDKNGAATDYPIDQGLAASTELVVEVTLDEDNLCEDGVEFGNYIEGSIHGVKFHDEDGDGVWDSDEDPWEGIQFKAYRLDSVTNATAVSGQKTTNYNWDLIDRERSDVHGEFWFTGLEPGIYTVVDTDNGTDGLAQSTMQPTDPPVDGVRLDPSVTGTNPYEADGTTLKPYFYEVRSRQEYAWEAGAYRMVPDLDKGGDVDQFEEDYADAAIILKNETNTSTGTNAGPLVFGNYLESSFHGYKYEDINGDGDRDDGEPGLNGVMFALTGTDGMGNSVSMTTLTENDPDSGDPGYFWFEGLKPGSYNVFEVYDEAAQGGDFNDDGDMNDGTDTNNTNTALSGDYAAGSPDGVLDVNQGMIFDKTVESFTVSSGDEIDADHDWGNYVLGSIHGVKFHDDNANGKWDQTGDDAEDWQPGVTFELYKYGGSTTKTIATDTKITTHSWGTPVTTVSDHHGEFWFLDLEPGTYEVVEVVPAGQISSTTGLTTAPTDQDGPSSTAYVIESRDEYVWETGATVMDIFDKDGVKIGDTADKVGLKVETVPTPGGTNDNNEWNSLIFGNYVPAKFHGYKFEDLNGDDDQDAGEPGLNNVMFALTGTDGMNNAVSLTTLTENDPVSGEPGYFWFEDLKPGSYNIFEVYSEATQGGDFNDDGDMNDGTDTNSTNPYGSGAVGSPDGILDVNQGMIFDTTKISVDLVSGDDVTSDHDWANHVLGSIHGVKFIDDNADGIWDTADDDEDWDPGVRFDLYRYGGATTKTLETGSTVTTHSWQRTDKQTTDAHGEFWFEDLEPGTYEIVERIPDGYESSTGAITETPDGDDAPSANAITISSRQEYVWEDGATLMEDFNGQGVVIGDNADEIGLKVEVNTSTVNGDLVSGPLVFGNYEPGSFHGYKYEDINGDGDRDDGEPGLNGVMFALTGTDGMGNSVSMTTLTENDPDSGDPGYFWFEGLKPGSYNVFEVYDEAAQGGDFNDDGDMDDGTDTNNTNTALSGDYAAGSPDGVLDVNQGMIFDKTVESFTVSSGDEIDADHDWGNYVLGSIHGVKFHDDNANGKWDQTGDDAEDWQPGVTFELYKYGGSTTKTIATDTKITTHSWGTPVTTVSDHHGEFWFLDLEPGTYEVVEVVPAGQISSTTGLTTAPTDQDGPSSTAYVIESRDEYVWETGATVMDIFDKDGVKIGDTADKVGLKVETVPTPGGTNDNNEWNSLIFGNYVPAKFHGYKFEDLNGDDDQDAGEPGLNNVMFALTGTDGMNNAVSLTTLTENDPVSGEPGYFWFEDLKPGSYNIFEVYSEATQGGDFNDDGDMNDGTDTNSTNPYGSGAVGSPDGILDVNQGMIFDTTKISVDLVSGDDVTSDHDWANHVLGSIHGVKFIDDNADGIWDTADDDEDWDPGVRFDLYRYGGATTKTLETGSTVTTHSWQRTDKQTTDAHGEFWFEDLEPGTYEIVERIPDGYESSTGAITETPDGDDAPSANAITISSRQEYVWEDGATLMEDFNGQGVVIGDNADEIGLKVEVNTSTVNGDLVSGPLVFGNYEPGSFHGYKYEDINGDGDRDDGEPGLNGVMFALTGTDGMGNSVSMTTLTENDPDSGDPGYFWFEGLKPGSYNVFEVYDEAAQGGDFNDDGDMNDGTDTNNTNTALSGDYAAGSPDGVLDVNQGMIFDKTVESFTVSSGDEIDADHDWGNYVLGSIHGVKFHDDNANGKWDQTGDDAEDWQPGVTFELYKYGGSTTKTIATDTKITTHSWGTPVTTVSDHHGEFWFLDLEPGTYEVVEVVPAGQISSTTGLTTAPTDQDGPSSTAYVIESRDEYVWETGATVMDIFDKDGVKIGDTADKVGLKVETVPTPGGTNDNNEWNSLIFGNYVPAKFHGYKFEDLNGDDDQDAGEPGLNNVMFALTGTDGMNNAVSLTTLTENDPVSGEPGYFWFEDLKPGSYNIFEVYSEATQGGDFNDDGDMNDGTDTNSTNPYGSGAVGSPDGILDVNQGMIFDTTKISVDLVSGDDVTSDHDWANHVLGSIHGVKFIDDNADGIWDTADDDEDWDPGVRFDLYRYGGATTKTLETGSTVTTHSWQRTDKQTTDAHGEFWFEDLEPGTYEIVERIPDGYESSTGAITETPDGDDAPSANAITISSRQEYVWEDGATLMEDFNGQGVVIGDNADEIGLKVEVNTSTVNGDLVSGPLVFGNYEPGSFHGYKYEDINGDGDRDDGEPGLNGVMFALTGTDGMGNSVSMTTLTENDPDSGDPGYFWFEGLKPGSYNVFEVYDEAAQGGDFNDDGDMDDGTDTNSTNSYGSGSVGSPDGILDVNQGMIFDKTVESFTVSSGDEIDADHDWGNYVLGSIHGVKFYDKSGEGKWDSGENALGDITFKLYRHEGAVTVTGKSGDKTVTHSWSTQTQVSDVHGEFWFEDLEPGTYELREILPSDDWEQTTSQATDLPDSDTGPSSDAYIIESRQEYVWKDGATLMDVFDSNDVKIGDNADEIGLKEEVRMTPELTFGNRYKDSSVRIFKFHDVDGDGIYDQAGGYNGEGEQPLENVEINLVADVPGTDLVIDTGLTASNGEVIFDIVWDPFMDLVPGTTVYLSEDVDGKGLSGNGRVDFSDINGDGQNDEFLHWSTLGSPFPLGADEHLDWKGPDNTPGGADNNTDIMVGNYITGSIHGFKFADLDADGEYSPDGAWLPHPEMPFEWAKFELLDAAGGPATDAYGDPVAIEDTGLDGRFWFVDLAPGVYTVTERMDLVDRNDADQDGFPDVIDTNNDGEPDTNGNGVPDIDEGLEASTPITRTLTILSGQEFVWTAGDAMLSETTVTVDDDSGLLPPALSLEAEDGGIVEFDTASVFSTTTSSAVFKHDSSSPKAAWHLGAASTTLTGEIAGGVTSLSFDVYGLNGGGASQAVLQVFDSSGTQIGADILSGILAEGTDKETIVATGDIHSFRIGGAILGDGVGIDNMVYTVASLKTELAPSGDAPADDVMYPELMWGNYYTGEIHGIKVHECVTKAGCDPLDPPVPAEGILFELQEAETGTVLDTQRSDENGEFWFLGVKPGNYDVVEVWESSSHLDAAPEVVSVMVDNGQVVVASLSQLEPNGMASPNGPWPENYHAHIDQVQVDESLHIENLMAGSIHGLKVHADSGEPIEGMQFKLLYAGSNVTVGTATTNSNGEFWFEDLTPGPYIVQEVQTGAVTELSNPIGIDVKSGEEAVAFTGQADPAHLDPGQYETLYTKLHFENILTGSVHGELSNLSGSQFSGGLYTANLFGTDINGDLVTLQSPTDGPNARGNSEFHFDDLLPGIYTISLDPPSGHSITVTIDSGEEEVSYAGQAPLDPGQFETPNGDLMFVFDGNTTAEVRGVRVSSDSWEATYLAAIDPDVIGYSIPDDTAGDQRDALGWENLNEIHIEFTGPVFGSGGGGVLVPADFDLIAGDLSDGSPGPVPGIDSVSYDAGSSRATLLLDGVLPAGRFAVIAHDTILDSSSNPLDGDYFGTLPSGDTAAGGDFVFEFNVHPGNVVFDTDGEVVFDDLLSFIAAWDTEMGVPSTNGNTYDPFADFDGSEDVGFGDLLTFINAFQTGSLSMSSPAVPPPAPVVAAALAVDAFFEAEDDDTDHGFESIVEDVAASGRRLRTR